MTSPTWFNPFRHEDPPKADPPTDPPADPPGDPADLGDGGKKALASERAARKVAEDARKAAEKLAAEQAARLKEFEDRDKTELERLTARADAAEKQLLTETAARLRVEVGFENGLTPDQTRRLQGTTREELAADAVALKELFPAAPGNPPGPKPDPAQNPGTKTPAPPSDFRTAEPAEVKRALADIKAGRTV